MKVVLVCLYTKQTVLGIKWIVESKLTFSSVSISGYFITHQTKAVQFGKHSSCGRVKVCLVNFAGTKVYDKTTAQCCLLCA